MDRSILEAKDYDEDNVRKVKQEIQKVRKNSKPKRDEGSKATEETPEIEGYYYIGSNRQGLLTKNAKGGIGVLIPENLREEIPSWMIDREMFGEMQHGYRTGKSVDDCLFIVTAAIETTGGQKKGLLAIYLDLTKAYNKVRRAVLRSSEKLGLHENATELLKILYKDNTDVLQTKESD